MQRRHSCENIRTLGVYRFKNTYIKISIKLYEASGIAGGKLMESKTVILYIPWRGSRKRIINNKANEVDKNKSEQEQQELPFPGKEQVNRKAHRHRYPAQIKNAGKDVQESSAVESPVFIRGEQFALRMNTEQMFFEIINIGYMYCTVFVVWEGFHIVVYDPINNEYGKTCYEFTGNGRCIEKQVEKQDQYHLIGFKIDQECRK